MKYFRKKYRFRRRSAFRSRRIFKRPRVGTRRFFNRQRRNPRPEIKWCYQAINNTTIDQNKRTGTDRLQPLSIDQGTAVNQRIGKSIKYRRCIFNISLNAIFVNQTSGAVNYDTPVRIVVWTPVTTATNAIAYITGTTPFTTELDIETVFDWNIIKVHRDVSFRMGYSGMGVPGAQAGTVETTAAPQFIMKRFSIPFPRNVEFSINSLIDPDRYTMYVTVFKKAATIPINYDLEAKTTYIDA